MLGLIQRVTELTSGLKEISSIAAGLGREGEVLADRLLHLPGGQFDRAVTAEEPAELMQQIARYAEQLSGSADRQSTDLLETGLKLQESAAWANQIRKLVAEAENRVGVVPQLRQATAFLGQLCGVLRAAEEDTNHARTEAKRNTTVLDQLAATIAQTLAAVQQLDGPDGQETTVDLARAVRQKARASIQIAVTAAALATDATELKRLLDALASEGTAATLP
ncbi:MAG: hypothetical protein ACM3XM_06040 [Mycobacterium leprae]